MATVTGFTAARMEAIENASIIDGNVVGDNLILTRFDTTTIDAGSVRGPTGLPGVSESELNNFAVPLARTISTTAPLTGGGDLSANRTLAVSAASETAAGVVELATNAEALTGTSTSLVTTPEDVAYVLARQPEWWIYAVGNDTAAITTGTGKGEFYMPFACTMLAYRLTAITSGAVESTIVDINKNGATTMINDKLSIDVSEKTSDTAATAHTLTTTAWAAGDICTIDFDQVGSGMAGIQVTFYVVRAP